MVANPTLCLAELPANPDLNAARRTLYGYRAPTDQQAQIQQRMLQFIDQHPTDAHQRSCRPGHLTASALVLDSTGQRVLLTHHRKLERWLQLGGHCDGDANLAGVALREAVEEGGIEDLRIDPRPVDLDIHSIPARPGEPEHLHLDCRFLVFAPAGATPTASAESLAVKWWTLAEAAELDSDDSVLRLLRIATARHR